MPERPVNPIEFGFYLSVAQVGMEMVAPIGLGWLLDHFLDWSPWGIVGGAVFGLVAGVAHLAALANRGSDSNSSRPRRKSS
jgi:F0F1-type ATP synthase assembly protein I